MINDLQPPQNLNEFFPWLKEESEKLWATTRPNSTIPAGMKWLPGLTDNQIADYEKEMGFAFPEIYKMYLRCMNGTEKSMHTYWEEGSGWSGEYGYPTGGRNREVVDSFYSYPRDIEYLRTKFGWAFGWVYGAFRIKQKEFDRKGIPHIMPIISHRFLVIDRCEINPVLSIYEDVLPYADSLNNFLLDDIFFGGRQQPNLSHFKVKFWLDEPVPLGKRMSSEEIRLATIIGDNYVVAFGDFDFDQKAEIVKRFLLDGKRVRVFIVFEGRKIRQPEVGMKLLQRIIEAVKETAIVEKQPIVDKDKKEWTMILAPSLPVSGDGKNKANLAEGV